nr:MAG TPA: ATP synthase subunit alpha [Caudoviricetes sp.]
MKNNIIIVHETLIQSILADIFSFLTIALLLLFNYYLLSGNVLIDLCFIFMAWIVMLSKGDKKMKRFNTKEEEINFLQEQ